ncbi:hypothetical protein EUA93_13895 [Nocardioides oleivorans]|uniref:Uncharacterized protein n=1 Tax=Nocardioides oleivorans TaxID=273676 RepID=A0A4Q2S4F5_9ACTN|nr:DUF6264 family protein [Nocardioides oleivorans]RYB95335.1 hypothetical protein EUA93_13895 [Nocardioides oleivorans]
MTQPASYVDQQRDARPTDRVVTVLLLIALVVLAPAAGFMGLLTAMASDSCGSGNECNEGLIGVGVITSAASPIVVALVALVWVVVRWRRGRTTWWVPLVAAVVAAGTWWIGALITFAAVGW